MVGRFAVGLSAGSTAASALEVGHRQLDGSTAADARSPVGVDANGASRALATDHPGFATGEVSVRLANSSKLASGCSRVWVSKSLR